MTASFMTPKAHKRRMTARPPSSSTLRKRDIGIGTLVWYQSDSTFDIGNCPGVITRLDPVSWKVFGVLLYAKTATHHLNWDPRSDVPSWPYERKLRLASVAEVDAYLLSLGKTAVDIITLAQEGSGTH